MTDPDGDSQMQSSSSASGSDFEMFPAARRDPSTSQTLHTDMPSFSSKALSGGVSPPASQNRTRPMSDSGEAEPDFMDIGENGSMMTDAGAGKRVEEEPGWGWKNPKAREEYDRSMEVVLDRGFSMKEFGELFDHKTIAHLEKTQG